MGEERERKKLSRKQQLHWDRRCLNSMLGHAVRMRERFDPDELAQVINGIGQAIGRIETALGQLSRVRIAKKWSNQR